MFKFNNKANNSHELVATKEKKPRGLEPPKKISIESLEAIVEQERTAELGPPPRISLESLRKLIPKRTASATSTESNSVFHVANLDSPEDDSLENLQLLVESCSHLCPGQIEISTRNLLVTTKNSNLSGKLRVWKIVETEDVAEEDEACPPHKSQSLENITAGKQHAEISKSKSVETIPATRISKSKTKSTAEANKPAEAQPESTAAADRLKPEIMLEKLRELSENNDSLEKWIASLNLPKEMDIPEIRLKIQQFLKNKSWEQHKAGKIRDVRDGSLAANLWNGFKELSTVKQILVIIALSILIAAVGYLTVQLLSLLWPSVLGFASIGETPLIEIGSQVFIQRQEPAFHLLLSHAEQAKPMSYAWANQYILYKYMR